MDDEVFITRISKITLGNDGIGRVNFLPGLVVTEEDVREHFSACSRISNGRSIPVLVDVRDVKQVEQKAREYFAGEEHISLTKAAAIIVRLPVDSLMGNLFMGLNKPSFPVKLFTSQAKALKWLKQYCDGN